MISLSFSQIRLSVSLLLNLFSSFQAFSKVYVNAEIPTPTTPEPNPSCDNIKKDPSYDPESFSKLKLNEKELFGSRWAINQKDAIIVYHAIDITDATLIHDNQLTLRLEFNMRQSWEAPGLEFPEGLFLATDPPGTFVSSDDKVLRYMWSPDSYISTARESNMNTVGAPLNLVYIFKNRTIIFKVRMFTKVACTSSFQWYPLDVQTCSLMIESYKYHDDIARYQWTDEKLYRPVVHKIRRLFQYDLHKQLKYTNNTVERGGRGKRFAYVKVKFTFERKLGNNIIQVYTPTVLVVVLSWFSFWLGLDAIPGRISLLVTCMLTLVTMHSGIKGSIPPVNYVTMMDVWMVCCMAMVFSAMCVFVIIKYAHWRNQQKQKEEETVKDRQSRDQLLHFLQQVQSQIIADKVVPGGGSRHDAMEFPRKAWGKLENEMKVAPVAEKILRSVMVDTGKFGKEDGEEWQQGYNYKMTHGNDATNKPGHEITKSKKFTPMWVTVDRYCRAFFPFLFCIFNVIYWPVLFNYGTETMDERSYHQNF